MRILLVEDERRLAELIESRLQKENYAVDVDLNGDDGLYDALTDSYDLLLLDVMLPGTDGWEILRRVRREGMRAKVIMLTARTALEDKLTGLQGGANDYITKPFHMDELVARVHVQLRRDGSGVPTDRLTCGDLELLLTASTLRCTATGHQVQVIRKEFQLLESLMQNPGQILSKEQLYDRVWGFESQVESNNLEAYLSFLRKKLAAIGSGARIKAVRGMGYRLEV